jgi:hypothetical protein
VNCCTSEPRHTRPKSPLTKKRFDGARKAVAMPP